MACRFQNGLVVLVLCCVCFACPSAATFCRDRCEIPELRYDYWMSYNQSVAYKMALYSKIAYSHPSDVIHWTCHDCTNPYVRHFHVEAYVRDTHHHGGSAVALIGYDPDPVLGHGGAIVVAFRGSIIKSTWLRRSRITKTTPTFLRLDQHTYDDHHDDDDDDDDDIDDGDVGVHDVLHVDDLIHHHLDTSVHSEDLGRVHAGFYDFYDHLRSQHHHGMIHSILALKKDHPDANIYVTGHSMGGALAAMAAADYGADFHGPHHVDHDPDDPHHVDHDPDDPHHDHNHHVHDPMDRVFLYSFGAPRAGEACFVKLYERRVFRSFRVVHNHDTVTRFPPVAFGHHCYRHTVAEKAFPYPLEDASVHPHRIAAYVRTLKCQLHPKASCLH